MRKIYKEDLIDINQENALKNVKKHRARELFKTTKEDIRTKLANNVDINYSLNNPYTNTFFTTSNRNKINAECIKTEYSFFSYDILIIFMNIITTYYKDSNYYSNKYTEEDIKIYEAMYKLYCEY